MADDSKDTPDYEVGYGRPPKHGRFQTGRSGNPSGRPRGSKNLATVILAESKKPVRVNGPGGGRTVTKLEASMIQLSNKAAQGDLRAQKEFFSLIRIAEEAFSSAASTDSLQESDRAVMQNILQRIKKHASPLDSSAPKVAEKE